MVKKKCWPKVVLQLTFGAAWLFFTIGLCVTNASADELVTFGDSISKGTPYLEDREGGGRVNEGGYQPYLVDLLNNANRASTTYNWGVGGENSATGADRIDDVLDRYPQADYVLILEGTNDWSQHISVSSTIDHLELMIDKSLNRGIEPILATLLPSTDKGGDKALAIRTEYNPRIRELARSRGIILADMYPEFREDWSELTYDGSHPNRSGYSRMAQVWFKALFTPLVRTQEPTNVSGNVATFNGLIRPNQRNVQYFFQYGPTENYGSRSETLELTADQAEASVSATVSGLTPQQDYHVRLVTLDDTNGYTEGNDITMTTGDTITDISEGSGCFIFTLSH